MFVKVRKLYEGLILYLPINIRKGTSWISVVFKENCLAGNYGYLFIQYDNLYQEKPEYDTKNR